MNPENEIKEETKEVKPTPNVTPEILLARKRATKALQMIKRNKYFHEDNAENAIINALNSGLGRKVRRTLAKKMMVKWTDYLEMEDAIVELYPERLNDGAKIALKQRYYQDHLADMKRVEGQRKIGFTRFIRNMLILNENMKPEQAEEAAKKYMVDMGWTPKPKEKETSTEEEKIASVG